MKQIGELQAWYRGRPYAESLSRLLLWQPERTRHMVLDRPWGVRVHSTVYVAPAEMETDGASIPRLFWRVLGPPMFTQLFMGAVIHDAAYGGILRCYNEEADWLPVEKSEADDLLRLLGCWNGYERWRAELAHWAVRHFGGRPWRKGHAANAGLDLTTLDYSLPPAAPQPPRRSGR